MSTSEHSNERRKYVRIPAKYILRCAIYSSLASSDEFHLQSEIKAVTKNFSAGGVLFEVNTKYEIGTLLQVEVDVPGWEKFKSEFYKTENVSRSKPVIALASVIRVEAVEVGKKFDIGACFVGIDSGHQWALVKYVKGQMKV